MAIVDLGLPDGSGLDLIARMGAMQPRVPILLGTSGAEREAAAREAVAAGADGFLPKPVESLAVFQAAIIAHLPDNLKPKRPRPADTTTLRARHAGLSRGPEPCAGPAGARRAARGLSASLPSGRRAQCAG